MAAFPLLARWVRSGPAAVETGLAGALGLGGDWTERYPELIAALRQQGPASGGDVGFVLGYLHQEAGKRCTDADRKKSYYEGALEHYGRFLRGGGRHNPDTRYFAQWQTGMIRQTLGHAWPQVEQSLLPALEHDALRAEALKADHCKDEQRKRQYLMEAHRWLEAACNVDTRSRHERYKAYHTLAEIKERLSMTEGEIREMHLKAYAIDRRHAEPLAGIVYNCSRMRQWNGAYLYSRFAVAHHHGNKPTGADIENVDDTVYQWRRLLYHCTACVYSGRIAEGKAAMRQLKAIVKEQQLTLPDQLLMKGSLLRLRVVAGLRRVRRA